MGTEDAGADPIGPVRQLPVGRAFFADERGVVLRSTWHLDRGFLNMSIWQQNLCVATFQLRVEDTSRLASFLVEGLGEAAAALVHQQAASPAPDLRPRPPVAAPPAPATTATTVSGAITATLHLAATTLAERIRSRLAGKRRR